MDPDGTGRDIGLIRSSAAPPSILDADLLEILRSPTFNDDPYPTYADLRDRKPVYRSRSGPWVLSRYEHVHQAMRSPSVGSDPSDTAWHRQQRASTGREHHVGDQFVRHLLFLDSPDHTRIRQRLGGAFTPRVIEHNRAHVTQLIDRLLERAKESLVFDVIEDFALPLAIQVICELLGVPSGDQAKIDGWARAMTGSIDPEFVVPPSQQRAATAAAARFAGYLTKLTRLRRLDQGDDLFGRLVADADHGFLSQQELITNGVLLVVVGYETTLNLIGNGVAALLTNRAEHERFIDDAEVTTNAVEELLRFDSPIQYTPRVTKAELTLDGVTIPAGEQVLLLLGAANRDPRVFEDPDRLDLGREHAGRHLAFGGGAHFCVGAPLARLEGAIALAELIRRFPNMRSYGPPERGRGFAVRGFAHLPVTLR